MLSSSHAFEIKIQSSHNYKTNICYIKGKPGKAYDDKYDREDQSGTCIDSMACVLGLAES